MIYDELWLDINKFESGYAVAARQNEQLAQIKLIVTNKGERINNSLYSVEFVGNNSKGELTDGKAVASNENGAYIYTFTKENLSVPGKFQHAYFRLFDFSGKEVTSTNFSLKILSQADMSAEQSTIHVSILDDILDKYNEFSRDQTNAWNEFVENNKEIINSIDPSGTLLTELINARKPENEESFPSIGERLNENDKILTDVDDTVYEFDKYPPHHLTTLDLAGGSVPQWAGLLPQKKEIYSAQVYSTDPTQSFIITRMDSNGLILDSMIVGQGGHGTTIGLETIGNDVYVWSNLDILDDSNKVIGNKLIRFKYTPNTEIGPFEYEEFDAFRTAYCTPFCHEEIDLIGLRFNIGNNVVIDIRKLSELKVGIDNLIGTVTIPIGIGVMQGCESDGNKVWYYTGAAEEDTIIRQYDVATGNLEKEITLDIGRNRAGVFLDDYKEPEGIFLYCSPFSKRKSLLANVVVGALGRRETKLYALAHKNALQELTAFIQHDELRADGIRGKTKKIPYGTTKLSTVWEPGEYYMTTAETVALEDHPDSGSSGWYLNNGMRNQNGTLVQILKRATGTIRVYERILNPIEQTTGTWTIRTGGGDAERLSTTVTSLQSVLIADEYYLSTADSNRLMDHPEPGVAGWFFINGASAGANHDRIQTLIKSSSGTAKIWKRKTNDQTAGTWTPYGETSWVDGALASGVTAPAGYELRAGRDGGTGFIKGRVKPPLFGESQTLLGSIPPGYRPSGIIYTVCGITGTTGFTKISITPAGNIYSTGILAGNAASADLIYLYCSFPIG